MPLIMTPICAFIAFYGYKRTKIIFNPITSMFLLWALILPFSCWGFYDTVIPSDRVYLIISMGLAGFLCGSLAGMRPLVVKFGHIKSEVSNDIGYKFNYIIIYVLSAITLVFYAFQIAIVIGLLASGYSYDFIRDLSISTDFNVLRSSATVTMTKAFIATPMSYLSLALLPMELLKKQKNKLIIIIYIVLMLGYILTTGGRSVLLWFALYFVVIFIMRRKKIDLQLLKKFLLRYKIVMFAGGSALLALLLWITISRKGEDVDLLNQAYIYFVCPIQYFDHHIEVVDNSKMFGYGMSSFYGLLYPAMFVLQKLGINVFTPHIETIYNMSFESLQKGYNIGGGIYMNAFVTGFYQPYLDRRYIGVILVMLLFGFFSARSFYGAYYKNNMKSLLIYLLLLQKIIFSFVRFYFTQQAQSICFLLAFLVIIKCSVKDNQQIGF